MNETKLIENKTSFKNASEYMTEMGILTAQKPKKAKTDITAIELEGEALLLKQKEILTKLTKQDKNLLKRDIVDFFYKGMVYKDLNGNDKIARTDGINYLVKSLKNNTFITAKEGKRFMLVENQKVAVGSICANK